MVASAAENDIIACYLGQLFLVSIPSALQQPESLEISLQARASAVRQVTCSSLTRYRISELHESRLPPFFHYYPFPPFFRLRRSC